MRGKSAKALAQQGFPYIRCWPRHRRKHRMRKLKKVAFSHFFDTLKREGIGLLFFAVLYAGMSNVSPAIIRSGLAMLLRRTSSSTVVLNRRAMEERVSPGLMMYVITPPER